MNLTGGPTPRMLFVRTYHGLLGGHLKVFDYLAHVAQSGMFEPVLYLTPQSSQSPREFLPPGMEIVDRPVDVDAYFLAGFNWRILDDVGVQIGKRPVVNLVQGLRHGLADNPRRAFLTRRALRICVSNAVERGVRATGLANGPVRTIPNGIDASRLAGFAAVERRCVFVGGAKNPSVAQGVAEALARNHIEVDLCCDLLPREDFLARMGRSRIALCLPDPHEGFFLPALEAMALGCTVVVPHCEGAQSFCLDGETCIAADYTVHALAHAVVAVWNNDDLARRLSVAGAKKASEHSLESERTAFIAMLRQYVAGEMNQ